MSQYQHAYQWKVGCQLVGAHEHESDEVVGEENEFDDVGCDPVHVTQKHMNTPQISDIDLTIE